MEIKLIKRSQQILVDVSTLGLAIEKYTQIAVVLVSANFARIIENVKKCVLRRPESLNFLDGHFLFAK